MSVTTISGMKSAPQCRTGAISLCMHLLGASAALREVQTACVNTVRAAGSNPSKGAYGLVSRPSPETHVVPTSYKPYASSAKPSTAVLTE